MNSLDYEEGVKHLLKVEPAFKSIIPKTKISFFGDQRVLREWLR